MREVAGTDQELYAEVMSLLNADSEHTILKNPAMLGHTPRSTRKTPLRVGRVISKRSHGPKRVP